ncbi:MAG: hypothetical protein MK102_18215 [Fuerstiella sp.]|nr:hypothetical protein [Fuerstiella sp.]
MPPAPQNPSDSGEVGGVQNDESETADSENFGEAPEDTSYAFLRRISPLLPPGKSQFDTGLVYSLYENRRPVYLDYVTGPDEVVDARLLRRTLYVPFAYRYGIADGVQLFANLPVGWSKNEAAFPGYDAVDNVGWIGDVTVGTTFVVGEPEPGDPDTIASLALTAPTGNSTFLSNFLEPEAQMGLGHFALSANLTSIRTIDPLVVFHGVGVVYQFDDKFYGRTIHVEPGMEFNYRLGVGFAVNDKVTLSSAVLGSYVLTSKVNNERLPHSTLEPITMRFAVTMADGKSLQEPFIQIGVTDDASTATLGWVVTY